MNELRKVDKDFECFYETQKILWKKELDPKITKNIYEKKKKILREQIIASYIDILEKKAEPIKLSSSQVSQCSRVSPFIIKKTFIVEDERINWEINALNKLEKFPCFPKILALDMKRRVFYMNDVGTPLKTIQSTKNLPKDILKQADIMIKSLKEVEVFHRDLSLEHFCLREGRLSLIDFEKCFLTNQEYERNKARNTSSWQKLKYHDMNHIRTMINAFYENLIKKEKEKEERAAKLRAEQQHQQQQQQPRIQEQSIRRTLIRPRKIFKNSGEKIETRNIIETPGKTIQNASEANTLRRPRQINRTVFLQNRRHTLQPFKTIKPRFL